MARQSTAKKEGAVINIEAGKPQKTETGARSVVITPPKFETAVIAIVGETPLVLHKFSAKARNTIIATQEAGQQAKKGRKREPKDFNAVYRDACHVSTEGWYGFPASAVRNALISACRTVGFKMTLAKLSLFCVADGYDEDGTGLVKITKGDPHPHYAHARNSDGSTDVRCRPMWDRGWEARITLRWDAEQFSASDVANLLARVGMQVGLGEGRPDSRMSAGQGWGTFNLVT